MLHFSRKAHPADSESLSPTSYKSMKNKPFFSEKNTRSIILKLLFPKWRTNLIRPFPLYWRQAD
jgi:hypothetical protein